MKSDIKVVLLMDNACLGQSVVRAPQVMQI